MSEEEYKKYAEFDIPRALKEIAMLQPFEDKEMISQNKVGEVHIVVHKISKREYILKIIDLNEFTEV